MTRQGKGKGTNNGLSSLFSHWGRSGEAIGIKAIKDGMGSTGKGKVQAARAGLRNQQDGGRVGKGEGKKGGKRMLATVDLI